MQHEGHQFLNLQGISDAEIEENLAAADTGLMCAVVSTLTGDLRWTQDPYRTECVNARQAHYDGSSYEVAPSLRVEVLDAALKVLIDYRDDLSRRCLDPRPSTSPR